MLPELSRLTSALGIAQRAGFDEEITYAWRDLPRELQHIPTNLRGELIARMCVAVSTGLFDGAINYIWNATILHLRDRVREFGLPVVAQIQQQDSKRNSCWIYRTANCSICCLKLNLISEDGFFSWINVGIRETTSLRHIHQLETSMIAEFTTFLNRCVRYATRGRVLAARRGVGNFITAIKGATVYSGQCEVWLERIDATHDPQRELLFGTVHGIYCDPATSEPARLTRLICVKRTREVPAAIRSDLIDRHFGIPCERRHTNAIAHLNSSLKNWDC